MGTGVRFREAEVPIRVRCDIHSWEEATIAVFDHPWFAVTSSDGSFEISGLPPGRYEIVAWHEVLKEITTMEVGVGPGATADVNIEWGSE
jgi:hypothetical protein